MTAQPETNDPRDEREPAVEPEPIKDLDVDGENAVDIRGGVPGPRWSEQCVGPKTK